MDKFKQYLLATAGLVILIGAVTLFDPVQLTGAPPAVIQGDVTVTNFPNPQNVTVTNTPLSVNLATTANVNVVNDANNPVPVTVQNAANNDGVPFEFTVDAQTQCTVPQTVFTVPTDEQFVVTDVIAAKIDNNQELDFARDGTRIFTAKLEDQSLLTFSHAFRTGLIFDEGEELTVIQSGGNCGAGVLARILVTGIHTTS